MPAPKKAGSKKPGGGSKKTGKKTAPLPSVIAASRAKELAKKKSPSQLNPLFEKRPRNFGIGQDIQPRRDLTRFLKWPAYIQLQRQRAVLKKRLKIPPTIAQFSANNCLDKQTTHALLKLAEKYRPESPKERKARLVELAEERVKASSAGKTAPAAGAASQKRRKRLRCGVREVTAMITAQRAQLVLVAADAHPLELVLHIPALCRKMNVAYCLIRGGLARLGRLVGRKTCAAAAFSIDTVSQEDRSGFNKLLESVRNNFNARGDELKRSWGGGELGSKSEAKRAKLEKARLREINMKVASAATA